MKTTARQQLLALASERRWSMTELMNYLQDRGFVADCALTFSDVPESDAKIALSRLTPAVEAR